MRDSGSPVAPAVSSWSPDRGMSGSGAEAARALAAEGAAEGGRRRTSLDRCDQPIPTPAHPNSTAHAGRNSLKSLPNRLPPFGAGIADDELDSEKMPETVPPPGCRRPVDLPPTARVVMRVCATRSGEYEWYEKRTIKTRRALSSHRRRARSWTAPARLPAIHRHHRRSPCGQVRADRCLRHRS